MSKVEQAVACFKGGFNCSQAILSTYGEAAGLERHVALKIATGFGGGMGNMGEVCGAVTGAIMVIGLMHGATKAEDMQAKERTRALVREFTTKFKARNGCIQCRELLGCDLGTTEGIQAAKDKNLFVTLCPKLVEGAAVILEEMIDSQKAR